MLYPTLITISYLTCSITGAKIAASVFNTQDPQKEGSRNLGATNMYRIAGIKAALLTFAIDFGKALIPLYISTLVELPLVQQMTLCIICILGHIGPLFSKFKGGKGVATALGCVCYMTPVLSILVVLYWILAIIITRSSFISSLLTAYSAIIWSYSANYSSTIIIGYTLIAVILTLTHRRNLANIKRKSPA